MVMDQSGDDFDENIEPYSIHFLAEKYVDKRPTFETVPSDSSFGTLPSPSGSISIEETVSMMAGVNDEYKAAILPCAKDKQNKTKMDELGLNKMRFSSLGLYGREEETKMLDTCLSRLTANVSTDGGICKELILIKGHSGTGKSTLAGTLQNIVEQKHGTFIAGKFDLFLLDEPYSAVGSVCREICWKIISLRVEKDSNANIQIEENEFEMIRNRIIGTMDPTELCLLTNIIPDLIEIVGREALPEGQDSSANQGPLETKTRLLFAFQKFMNIVSLIFEPLVIVLDDLQWADAASMELMKVLMMDQSTNPFMIIGCYRSNEVDETHLLAKVVKDLKEDNDHDIFRITEIELGNLTIPAVNSIMMVLLNIDDESQTMPLAKLCHKRTLGNVFFLLAFVKMMKEKEIIKFSIESFRWLWDIENIEEKTAAAVNVVDILKEKMAKTTIEVNQLLQIAACLGNTFDKKTLHMVWTELSSNKISWEGHRDESSFQMSLNLCVDEGYLELLGSSSYRFLHDKVQEAAMSLTPDNEAALLQYEVGTILLSGWDMDNIEDNIFVIASLLNSSCFTKDEKTAKINLQAAERAKSLSAFSSVANYASKGINALPDGSWQTHRHLALSLYSIGAEAESFVGSTEKAHYYCEVVLDQPNLALLDKMRVYHVMIENKGSAGQYRAGLEICLEVLERNGCKFPKNRIQKGFHALYGLLKLRKNPPNEEILNKPLLSDPQKLMSMKLLSLAAAMALSSENKYDHLMIINRMIRWSMRYGICDESPSAIAGLGYTLMHHFGNVGEGLKVGEIALSMSGKTQTSYFEPRTMLIGLSFIYGWVHPLPSVSEKFMEGYRKGMKVGDAESAMWHACQYSVLQTLSGKTLTVADDDFSIYVLQMDALKKHDSSLVARVRWQAIQNLMGLSGNTTTLTGEKMDEEKFLKDEVPSSSSRHIRHFFAHNKRFLCTYFGEYELGAKLAIKWRKSYSKDKETGAILFVQFNPFYDGISLYAMARKTKKRSYRMYAKRAHALLCTYGKRGFINVVHQLKLLDAEKAALVGKKEYACKLYEESSVLAVRGGFVQDAALSNERYTDFLLESSNKNANEDASYRLEKAITYYSQWGATAKVDMIHTKYAHLLSGST